MGPQNGSPTEGSARRPFPSLTRHMSRHVQLGGMPAQWSSGSRRAGGGGAGLPSNRCLVCVPGLLAVAGALGRRQDPIGQSRPWTWPYTEDGVSPSGSPARFPAWREVRSPSPKTHPLSDSGPLELIPRAAEPSLCAMPLK